MHGSLRTSTPGAAVASTCDGMNDLCQSATSPQNVRIRPTAANAGQRRNSRSQCIREPSAHVADSSVQYLGYCQDWLIVNPGTCVLAVELFDDFNDWITQNGHQPWSQETFSPKFAQHSETTRHGVEARRHRDPQGLARYPKQGVGPSRAKCPCGWVFGPAPRLTSTKTIPVQRVRQISRKCSSGACAAMKLYTCALTSISSSNR